MKKNSKAIKLYALRMLGMLLALSVLRFLFLIFNKGSFAMAGAGEYLQSFAAGVYFDFIYSFYALLPLAFLILFGSALFKYIWVRRFESFYYLAILLVTTVLACIDMAYYPFVKTHVGADLLFFMDGENNISIWTYIFNYWYLLIVCLALPYLVWRFFGRMIQPSPGLKWTSFIGRLALLLVMAFVVRGGTRLRPITSLDAVLFAPANMENLVANPEFIFIESLSGTDALFFDPDLDVSDISESNRKNFANPMNSNGDIWLGDSLLTFESRPNIVMIILESFGKEFTSLNEANKPSYTPFLDSLMKVSVNFRTAFANGQKSKDAIPAMFTGMPALMENGFLLSKYSKNELPALPKMLKELGYTSMFFHGANNGSMGFRNYLYSHGLDLYFGIDEYPEQAKKEHFDGHWGIFDGPYFNYFTSKLDQQKEPFFATLFTLSSHDPYAIPEAYRKSIPEGKIKLHKSVGYADQVLLEFFAKAKKSDWYKNTIFIVTADHSSLNSVYRYQAGTGKYEIPLLIYLPQWDSSIQITKPVQHLDLLPTVLDMVNYPDSINALGESLFSKKESPLLFKDGSAYLFRKGDWEVKVVNNKAINLFDLKNDPERMIDVIGENPKKAEEMLVQMQRLRSNLASKLIYNDL